MNKTKPKIGNLKKLEKSLNYKFLNPDLLQIALTHSSYANENKLPITKNNERLEFLGDTVLNLVVSQYLYNKYKNHPEGELTKIRAKVVCEYSLAYAAKKIGLGNYLLLGKGEEATGGRDRDSILADAVEAIVGAIYMDSSFETTSKVLLKKFEDDIVKAVAKGNLFVDYKTELQERFQKKNGNKIDYTILEEEGPEHNKTFHMAALMNGQPIGKGAGRNKKEAEQMAAKDALISLGEDNE